jgi:protein-S-isoprenylcysteine O-methyltransferase Ste14
LTFILSWQDPIVSFWFLLCVAGVLTNTALHFVSVEHVRLETRFGEKRGSGMGRFLGGISGWLEFLLLFLLWASPQPRFALGGPQLPFLGLSLPLYNIIIALPLFLLSTWISVRAVILMGREVGWDVVNLHSRTGDVVTSGPYSLVRHPQYLGAILAHFGGSILASASYALLFSPLYIATTYAISWKEERELCRELGQAYLDYRKRVPMLIPLGVFGRRGDDV